jgi:hypothetical protein
MEVWADGSIFVWLYGRGKSHNGGEWRGSQFWKMKIFKRWVGGENEKGKLKKKKIGRGIRKW